MKALFTRLILASLMMLQAQGSVAWAEGTPQPGKEFDQVAQVITTDTPAKIEVMEIFWYGCIHCYQMETPLNAWVKKLPSDVYFKRVPGLPNPSWAPMAKAYYALQSLGMGEKLHTALFEAVHKQRTLNPTDEKAIIEWVTLKAGQDKVKVEQAFNSFATKTALNRAAQLFRASGATGVPSLIVDGQYITSGTMAGGNEAALKTADYVIENVRKDKASAKK
jgi:protein dithiol oxidoreductase (disulfide-forming)